MASISRRGDLQWQARVRRRGYPVQIKTFNTRADAEAWARQVESEIDRGVFISRVEAESTTLAEALARYEREISPGKKSHAREVSLLRTWTMTPLSARYMAAIRSADIAKLRDDWLKATNPPLKPASVLRRLAILSHVFTIARKEWGMESLINPVGLVRKPQANNARTRRIAIEDHSTDDSNNRQTSNSELDRIVAASHSKILPAIVWLAVETAMRRGEIVSLLWEHVDLNRRVAHLPDTKNGNSRDIPLSARAVDILKDHQRSRCESALVFSMNADAVTRAFQRAVTRARESYEAECAAKDKKPNKLLLTDLRFHDLRHEATSRLASIFPMHELSKITGHRDPRMLMRYYHPRAEDLAKKLG